VPESPNRSSRRSVASVLVAVLMLATVAAIGATPAEAKKIVSARARYPVAIEPLAGYQGQTTCSPVAKPGVVDLSKRLLKAFPTTRSLGIVRACSVGGQSEHKEGRAFDWGGLNAHSAKDRARVARFVLWLMKSDTYGNRYAMTRRLGIQYLIWNHKIWGSYSASAGWRKYTGADPHTNHVHISFTWAGARKATSFWTGKVAAPAPPPAPRPTPTPPVPTPSTPPTGDTTPPRAEPVPAPSPLPQGAELVDETVTLYGTSSGTSTSHALTAGQPYLVEASGTWQWGNRAGRTADAQCSTTDTDPSWQHDRSVHTMQPSSDHLDLYVDGNDMVGLPDTDTGGGCDTVNHTYRWTYTPTRTGRVTLASWDPTTLADNSGALKIRIIKSSPLDFMTWQVPANAGAGATSPGALNAGDPYVVTVSGIITTVSGVQADAACSTTPADSVWRRNRSADPNFPRAERLDVLVDRQAMAFSAVNDTNGSSCDITKHTYRVMLTPSSTRPINLRVDDPTPLGNVGALTVTVTRVVQPTRPETVKLDTAWSAGAQTAGIYVAGKPLTLTAVGTYALDPNTTADAECTRTVTDPAWTVTRSNVDGDVTVGAQSYDWLNGASTCATNHSYTLAYTPTTTGWLSFGIADTVFSDNVGTVTLTVTPGS
jgi:hypothetical protein